VTADADVYLANIPGGYCMGRARYRRPLELPAAHRHQRHQETAVEQHDVPTDPENRIPCKGQSDNFGAVPETDGVTSRRSERSYARLTRAHLVRLRELADEDHDVFSRARPEYADRRVAVTLAQGAALHYVDGRNGVKDFDVWSFYAPIPDGRWPAFQRQRRVDFGLSEFGRQRYDFASAPSVAATRRWRSWEATHTGRRVDLFVRPLAVPVAADEAVVVDALRAWLCDGQTRRDRNSAWYLARKAVVLLDSDPPGARVWPPTR